MVQCVSMMGTKITAHCLAVILLCCCIFFCSSAAHHRVRKKHFSPAVVVGAVFCDTCFVEKLSESSRFISGATVAIECSRDGSAKPSFRKEVSTDRRGVFRIRLPLEVTKHVKSIRSCSVSLIRSGETFCAVPSTATLSGSLLRRFKSQWQTTDVRVLSAGVFAFKPLRRPEFCDRRRDGASPESEQKAEQPAFFFPPFLPSPPSFLPPNPLQPPPSVLPPLPFQPSPPPFVNLPPLPILTPPPPPPPAFRLPPFPFPFPFPPSPLFPGIPPAFTSKNASP